MDYEVENDRELSQARLFNPEDMEGWLKVPPSEFILTMAHEYLTDWINIQVWTEILLKEESIRDTVITFESGSSIRVESILDIMLKSTRITQRLIDVSRAYAKQKPDVLNYGPE